MTMLPLRRVNNPTAWTAFFAELDAWRDAGRVAAFWWRDDDATDETPALRRLLDIAGDTPLSLASIPKDATTALANTVAARPHVSVLQHGYAHANHAPDDEKKAEFGPHRPLDVMQRDLTTGFKRLRALFGPQFHPMFVPPWNRMADAIAPLLPKIGFQSFSTYGTTLTAPGPKIPTQINTHADIIDWRGGRKFLGEAAALDLAVQHLSFCRQAKNHETDSLHGPTGLLTHHAAHDDACWTFIENLVRVVTDHPATIWKAPAA
jgi:hypothetical protein